MREHLVFLLAAPMGSFGGYAGHERRGSGLVPLRSALLGLIGAALGIERADTQRQRDLRAYSVAVQSFRRSAALRDYHTVQTVPTAKARQPMTRLKALGRAGGDVNTVITIRDYRSDVLIGAAVWGAGPWTLSDLADHLRQPRFPLYVGRKSCPLASPLDPKIISAGGPVEALASIAIPGWLRPQGWSEQERMRQPVHSDPVEGAAPPSLTEQAPGEPLDRQIWTFAECPVWQLDTGSSEQGEGG